MTEITIKHRWNGTVLFSCELTAEVSERSLSFQMGFAVTRAIESGASLLGADLRGADLLGADLLGADLRDADLLGASLLGASLRGADLRGASLLGADLHGADLRDASLLGADLRGADLTPIRDDFWAVLSSAPKEVDGLRKALADGRVDGSTYHGDCACLVGTLANVRGVGYASIPGLAPNPSRPIERFFMGIKRGDTPATNEVSRLALAWADEWAGNMRAAFGPQS